MTNNLHEQIEPIHIVKALDIMDDEAIGAINKLLAVRQIPLKIIEGHHNP